MSTADAAPPGRIAFLLSSLKFGGAERVVLNLAHALKDKGWAIDILLMSQEGELLEEARKHFTVIDLACARTWRLPVHVAGYLRRARPTALISSFWKLNLCACMARAARPATRLIVWEHSPPSRSANSPAWLYGPSASIAYRMATQVIAVSQGVADDVGRITVGLGRRVTAIHNAIPAPSVETRIAPRASAAIVWVGRFADPKNPELMLEAFARLPLALGCRLTMLGDGDKRAALEERALSLGIGDRVVFPGFQPDAYEFIGAADVLVLTSDREGLGNVLIEALYAGRGIVSTDCGEGVHEIIADGRYGTIVPVGDAEAVARAIADELCHPRDPDVQRAAAARFDPAMIADRFLAALGLPARG